MISFDAIAVLFVLLFILISLYKELIGPAFTFIIGILVLGVLRILSPSEILSGFANEQVMIIIMLLLLGNVFRQTSLLDILFDYIFKSVKTPLNFLGRMILVVAFLSAFLNNTPLVAILMPYVKTWSRRRNVSPSKLLMPLSFAAILGGCATLIGTSTNLIVNGLVAEQNIIPNLEPLSIFEFSYIGVPMIVIGAFYLIFFAYKHLPDKPNLIEEFTINAREYVVELQIKENSPIIGKTIKEAQLRNLEGLYLFEIIRENNRLISVSSDTVLFQDDILIFAGDTKSIAGMLKKNPSLHIPSVGMFARKKNTEIVEIVISHNSNLINRTIKSENFRSKYDATVIAVHRNGEHLSGKIGVIEVRAGDALLLLAGENFQQFSKGTNNFYQISKVKEINRLGVLRSAVLIGGSLLTIFLSALNAISLFNGLMVMLTLSLMMKITSPKQLSKSIDYELALIIVLSLAIGTAMVKTGLAHIIANIVIKLFIPTGIVGILFGIYFITGILAAFITNKAAVAIIFPISLSIATNLNYPATPFILVVSFAAAANFMTPIGYQTNLMVYGPGGYSFKAFMSIGLPLTIIYMIVTVIILRFMYF